MNRDETWLNMIKELIYERIEQIDFSNPDFDLDKLKLELKEIIGQTPAVKINWDKTEMINELKKEAGLSENEYKTVVEKPKRIDIIFTDNEEIINLKYLYE